MNPSTTIPVQPTKPTTLVISVTTAEAIANYLATKPYIEVYQLIDLMQQLKPLPVAKEAEE